MKEEQLHQRLQNIKEAIEGLQSSKRDRVSDVLRQVQEYTQDYVDYQQKKLQMLSMPDINYKDYE